MNTADIKKTLRTLDGIRISQRFSWAATVCGSKKDRNLKGELNFSFSLLKGCFAALAALAGLAALCCAYKNSVKKKLIKKLKKKYRFVKAAEKPEK